MQGKQQECIHLLYESLVGQCEYTKQPKGSFWCHVVDTKGSVLLLIYKNKFQFIVLDLSFSFRYLVQLKLLQSLMNEATSAQALVILPLINWISRLKKYDQLSCIEFTEVYLVRELVSENEKFSRGRRRSLLVSNTLPNSGSLMEQSWCY